MYTSLNAPWWLPGGNLQTIWSAKLAKSFSGAAPEWRRERWTAPDGDFVDVDFLLGAAAPARPMVVMFHGLEGSSSSHYVKAMAQACRDAGVGLAVPHFRGCSGELNLAPRAYHSGDWEEIDWILRRLAVSCAQLHAVGVSLGGNALMRWAGELGSAAAGVLRSVCSVSSPLDLAASGAAIGRGFNRQVYTRMFLATMKPRALLKLRQFPGLFDEAAMQRSRDLYEFDNVVTAPLHGFKDTNDYWARASAKPHLGNVAVPALCLNAKNDPFVPAESLPQAAQVSRHVSLWQPQHGGHVGFAQGSFPGEVTGLAKSVLEWSLQHG